MTFAIGRKAIETYFATQWASATPVGFNQQPFEPVKNSVRLTIQNGLTLQGSIGRTLDRIDNIGLVQIQIFTSGDLGSSAWEAYAETIQNIFMNVTIDSSGVPITATGDAFVKFSPNDQHPYIASSEKNTPFTVTTINAPFVRYTFK